MPLLQPDGKIVIVGSFTTVNGVTRVRVARLNATGSLDTGFDPGAGANGEVVRGALQADGKIVVGGDFSSFNGVSHIGIARLNADGSLDAGFAPTLGSTVRIRSLAVQGDGKILLGGVFATVNGAARSCIARLNADGTLDTIFSPGSGANGAVRSIVVQSDSKIMISGDFDSFNGVTRYRVARLNSDGSLDSTFNPGAGAPGSTIVYRVAIQSDGKYVLGGSFTTFNGVARNRIARLNTDGSLDTGFTPSADNYVGYVVIQPDGKLILSGGFTNVNGAARNRVARLNMDGTLDPNFAAGAGANLDVDWVSLQPDGNAVIGGIFTTVDSVARNRVARLTGDPVASLQFNSATATVTENAGSVTLSVQRTISSANAVSVNYATTDGTATASGMTPDYQAVSGTLYWTAGDTAAKPIPVTIKDRFLSSGSVDFVVTLSAPSNGAVLGSPSQTKVTILDTDQAVATIREVDLLSPPSDITVVQGQQLDIYGSVTATVNTLHGEFFALDANQANARSLGTFDNQVFNRSPNWTPALGDSYLRLTVTDTSSNTSASTTHPIHVLAPAQVGATPQANLFGGLDGRTVALNDTVTVVAQAIDSDGNALQNAQFYLDGVPITTSAVTSAQGGLQPAVKTTATQSGTLLQAQVSVAKSQQLVTVVGTKANGVSAVSSGANLYSKSGSGTPPTCSISNLANGASVSAGSAGQNVSVAANAGGAPVSKVELFIDRQSAGTLTAAPYNFTLPAVAQGVHALSAITTDSNGVAKVSAPVVVTAVTPASTHPGFFTGEVALGQGVYYLAFPGNGNIFGYYEYLSDPRYIYHFDLGFEYVFDLGNGGVVFYDFTSQDYFYTGSTFAFPYLYDFGLQAFLYYYPDPNNPQRYNTNGVRYFFNFSTGKVISK